MISDVYTWKLSQFISLYEYLFEIAPNPRQHENKQAKLFLRHLHGQVKNTVCFLPVSLATQAFIVEYTVTTWQREAQWWTGRKLLYVPVAEQQINL